MISPTTSLRDGASFLASSSSSSSVVETAVCLPPTEFHRELNSVAYPHEHAIHATVIYANKAGISCKPLSHIPVLQCQAA